jgi:hypothetical protein
VIAVETAYELDRASALQAQFDVLKARLAGEPERSALGEAPSVDAVAADFGLSAFERDLLVLAAGVELDTELAAACGKVTFELAAHLLPEARWEALAPMAPLRRWRLVTLSAGPLAGAAVRIEERVLFHLIGAPAADPRLEPIVHGRPPPALVAEPHFRAAAAIAEAWAPGPHGWPVIQLTGDDPEGAEDVAALVAHAMGWSLGVLRAADVPARTADRQELATLWTRESLLADTALLIVGDGELAELLAAPTLIATREPISLRRPWRGHAVQRPSEHERRRLWGHALDAPEPLLASLAGRYPVSARSIAAAAPVARAALEGSEDPVAALRSRLRPAGQGLSSLARRVEPAATWDDLVLPEPALATLREIAAQVRNRATVHEDWGFAAQGGRGLGITALFSGQSGTGKTLAAEVLARELALDLFVIDLSAVVSKYIGETEKNLRTLFDSAEDGAILLFDEADALFGKRTDVKDSHDRYANLEVSYLLQRMEAYRGLAILTTNVKSALDRAFQRRIRFVVSFPFPDAALRERIWRGVFPPGAPLGRLDWSRLASLDLSGGSIRSIAVNAAFLAAEAGGPVRMQHLRAAAKHEFAKLELPDTGKRGAW